RLTHLMFCPDPSDAAGCLQNPLARSVMTSGKNLIAPPAQHAILDRIKACARQIDACGMMAEAGLRGEELLAVCRGRIGIEAGTELAFAMLKTLDGAKMILPPELTPEEFGRVAALEQKGGVIEVIQFLRQELKTSERHDAIAR